jgi:hypothetical protein
VTSLGRLRVVMIAAAVAIAGLGGVAVWLLSDDEDGSDATEPAPPAETADPIPRLPAGWTKSVNAAGGFALGVPPGWSEQSDRAKTTLRSPGSSVVVAITADRSEDALDQDLDAYALGIAERLEPGAQQRPLRPLPRSDDPAYETAGAVVIDAPASDTGGAKRLEVIIVRRRDLAAYPLLIASDAAVERAELDPVTAKLVRSLRGRPAG